MELISFEASDTPGKKIEISKEYVQDRVKDLMIATDLRKYII
jgi:ATP-dependent protease HslVU (ClpYQ) ATPase subunit